MEENRKQIKSLEKGKSQRSRRQAREILEIYLLHLLMAYRRLIWIGGLLLIVYGILIFFISPLMGLISLVPALFLFFLGISYPVALYTAKVGAWIATLGRREA